MRTLLALSLAAAACGSTGGGMHDFSTNGSPDLAMGGADLASSNPDFSTVNDLAPPADLAPPPPDLARDLAMRPPSDLAMGACNNLVDVSKGVVGQYVAQAPPAPQGGALPDGTYALTGYTVAGNQVTLTIDCPQAQGAQSASFTATPTTLTLFGPTMNGQTPVLVSRKQ